MDTITTARGNTFNIHLEPDESMGMPWEECDGHGIISERTTRDKRPGELVLHTEGNSYLYYDFAATMKLASADGWDAEPYMTGTKGEQAYRAVMRDYEVCRQWCNGERWYAVMRVTLLDADGDETKQRAYLGGIDTGEDQQYILEEAHNLAHEIESNLQENHILTTHEEHY